MKKILLLLMTLLSSSQLYSEEVRYIRDELYVPLRSGQTTKHRIVHKGLVSGTPVTVIEMSEDETYSLVRTQSGIDGWIQSQYLSDQPAGRDLYNAATEKISKLETQNSELKQELNTLKKEVAEKEKQVETLTESNAQTSEELATIKDISGNALKLNQDNQRLLQENQVLKNEADVLRTDNQRLNDAQENDAFLNGAFAVVIGVMLALIVPRLTPKKRDDWA